MMQVEIGWTVPSGRNARSVLHFDRTSGSGTVVSALNTWLSGIVTVLSDQVSAQILGPFRILQPQDGQLVGLATIAPQPVHTGSIEGEPVADASQALIRWQTTAIADGHQVRGRTFIPGVPAADLVSGNLANATRVLLEQRSQSLAAGSSNLAVWHRPKWTVDGVLLRPGSVHAATSSTCWTELATQRNRRNKG